MPDAWRAYLEMALGLTEEPRKKARKHAEKAVVKLVSQGGATAVQVQGLVEDLLSTGMANREAVTNIVRYEVDRALGLVGLATADEVGELNARVRDLERQLREERSRATATPGLDEPGSGGTRLDQPAPTPGKVAKKAIAKKAIAKKVTPSTAPANVTPVETTPAAPVETLTVETAAAAPVKKAVAKKAVAKKAIAKKVAPEVGAPAGTAVSPNAAVKEAAAATELPPVGEPVFVEPVVAETDDRPEFSGTPVEQETAAIAVEAAAPENEAAASPAKTAAKRTPAKKVPAKTAAAKTTPVKTTVAKKTAPKKSPGA